MKILLYFLVLLFCSCTSRPLFVYTQYLSNENLASSYVKSPDPHLDQPEWGQKLFIEWSLPRSIANEEWKLLLKLRFKNGKEETLCFRLCQIQGYYTYHLLNENFSLKGGISTYKAGILKNGEIYTEWKHPLWEELIQIGN
jgi:hypothetical protein